ncbi:MAG: dTDP-4-dehydrorhamnose reductase [Elusimicrobia bacterium RIFOXYA2_FULL_50_26]|nr:MAG: dTDP-4-dehydrorhamnose reductase [Elusimicrobia bacterium RIFOXYA2_FULL_50_26]OGS24944.1 MAG: dTDP-4-dehydrorhamnose reductase [Elusimicrobia bacterium RIFOXYB2_FULL_50_12]
MKVLITGINGLLGSELAPLLADNHEVIGVCRNPAMAACETQSLDITDQIAVYHAVTRINPDIIIHSAALANVDECENNPDNAFKTNCYGTRNLALACQRFDAALLYVSTDYVFSGKQHPPSGYTEFDATGPLSVYGTSKLAGEWMARHLLNKFYIVRTAWLFGKARPNFIKSVDDSLSAGKEINACTDMTGSPTCTRDAAEAISTLIDTGAYGIYHVTNEGFGSRYEIASYIARIKKYPAHLIKKIEQKQLRLPAMRPVFSGLNNYAWKLNNLPPIRPWQDAVKEFLAK